MKTLVLITTAALAAALTACSSSGTTSSSSTPAAGPSSISASPPASGAPASGASTSSPAASAADITIHDFAFTVTGHVAPGAKIMVHNKDSEAHTVTSDKAGAFDVTVPASGTVQLVAPKAPGSYKFHCTFHASMHGTLTVTG